jgi:hypothetical protein
MIINWEECIEKVILAYFKEPLSLCSPNRTEESHGKRNPSWINPECELDTLLLTTTLVIRY